MQTYNMVTEICPDEEWTQYMNLCNKMNIDPPSKMQEEMGQHFVIIKNKKVVSGASIMTANINDCNRRICLSIELMVSTEKGGGKTIHDVLAKNVKKRVGTSYMVTQALESTRANEFWYKHMARHREADALVFMFFMLDPRYKLCEDITNLRITL